MPYMLLLPLVLFLGAFFLSLGSMFIMSLRPFQKGAIGDSSTVANYQRFLFDSFYLKILFTSLLLGLTVVLACIVVGYPVAYYIARFSRFKGLLIALCLVPLLTSAVVRIHSWVYILGNAGAINRALMGLNLRETPLPLMYNNFGVGVALVHVSLPFMILSTVAALQSSDVELEEAAQGLGARRRTVFREVTFPLSLPGVVAGSLLVFTLSIASYVTPAVLGSPRHKLVSVVIFETFVGSGNWPFGSAMSFVLLPVAVVVTVWYYRVMSRRFAVGRHE